MMNSRRHSSRRKIKAEMNIVPFLDVLLVLLLIFMATSPVLTQSVSVELPSSNQSKNVSSADRPIAILEVDQLGHYTLMLNQQQQLNLSNTQIIQQIQTQLAKEPDTLVLVGGAKQASYNEIISALNLLKNAGVVSVGLMTQPVGH